MASSNSDEGHGGDFYRAAPYRAREGLITRRQGNNSGEIQLEINDLEQGALDYGVTDLRGQVRKLRNVSYEIEAEAKYHRNLVKVLKLPLVRAQAALKNNSRRLNQRIVRDGSDHVKHVILFAVVCIFVLYFWSKFSGIWK
ncbi:bet1-like protein At4g14600 [Coffea arabica]|uniref:Bet1-like protein At4g14600 n=1 Tax=Coffea arabica TaxID=13443 RepID=A0A6P6XCI0_COFAR|nr:bet1-like protein At4g14600 [Coffea arabica]